MTARTQAQENARKEGDLQYYPLAVDKVWKGAPVFTKSSGRLAFTNDGSDNTLAVGDRFVGIAAETIDNTDDEDLNVRVYRKGSFRMLFSDTLTQANVGDEVYVNNTTDDAVVTVTADSANPGVAIGRIVEFIDANEAYVAIDNYVDRYVSDPDSGYPLADYAVVFVDVTVTSGQASGTATVVAGDVVLGIYPATNQDQFVDNVAISSTTLTVTLAANATANNVFKVAVLRRAR